MTTLVICGVLHAQGSTEGCQGELVGGRGPSHTGKPSVITRHGKPEAVVLGFADWERLSRVPSFGRLLMSVPLETEDLAERNHAPMRDAGL